METLCKETGCTKREGVKRCVSAHNTVTDAHGYSPSQWAYGRNPTWAGNLWRPEEPDDELPLAKLSNETFLKGLERQVKAKEILLRKINQRMITLAKNAATRKEHKFFPGEVVYAWRQGKRKDSKHRPHTSKGGINRSSKRTMVRTGSGLGYRNHSKQIRSPTRKYRLDRYQRQIVEMRAITATTVYLQGTEYQSNEQRHSLDLSGHHGKHEIYGPVH